MFNCILNPILMNVFQHVLSMSTLHVVSQPVNSPIFSVNSGPKKQEETLEPAPLLLK